MELQECFERITNEIDNFIDNGECPVTCCLACKYQEQCHEIIRLRNILENQDEKEH